MVQAMCMVSDSGPMQSASPVSCEKRLCRTKVPEMFVISTLTVSVLRPFFFCDRVWGPR